MHALYRSCPIQLSVLTAMLTFPLCKILGCNVAVCVDFALGMPQPPKYESRLGTAQGPDLLFPGQELQPFDIMQKMGASQISGVLLTGGLNSLDPGCLKMLGIASDS